MLTTKGSLAKLKGGAEYNKTKRGAEYPRGNGRLSFSLVLEVSIFGGGGEFVPTAKIKMLNILNALLQTAVWWQNIVLR